MNSNTTCKTTLSAAELAERINRIRDDLLEVAGDYVATLDARPEIKGELIEQGVNPELLRRLEALGRGQIHPQLVFKTTRASEKLLSLPLSEQARALSSGLEVLDADETTVRTIPPEELSNEQIRLIFHRGSIRTIAEQRTWLREQKRKLPSPNINLDFRVGRDHVVTLKPGKWSKRLIIQWLAEMD